MACIGVCGATVRPTREKTLCNGRMCLLPGVCRKVILALYKSVYDHNVSRSGVFHCRLVYLQACESLHFGDHASQDVAIVWEERSEGQVAKIVRIMFTKWDGH